MKKRCLALSAALCCCLSFVSVSVPGRAEPQRETVGDSEMGWYNSEKRVSDGNLKDSVRVIKYDPNATEGWAEQRNHFIRHEEDPDGVAVQWMHTISGPADINDKPYDVMYKELAEPVRGGAFAFDLWFRNGYPTNSGVYKLQAIAYEIDGTAHELAASESPIVWSGDHVSASGGWQHYSAAMPADAIIYKMAVKMFKDPANAEAHIQPGYDADWSTVDNIRFENTEVVRDDFIRVAETGWKNGEEDAPVSKNAFFPVEGDSFVAIYGGYNPAIDLTKQAIVKTLDQKVKNGRLTFKVFNPVNSNVAGQPQFKVRGAVYDEEGTRYPLALLPGGDGYLGFTGTGDQVYQGLYAYADTLPADKVIVKAEIAAELYGDIGMGPVNFFVDDIKFVGSAAVGEGEGGGEGGGEITPPTKWEEFPKTKPFTPDDGTDAPGEPARQTVNDSELGWYNEEILYNEGVLVDHCRIIKYEEGYTESDGWNYIKNFFIRPETDENLYAMQFMHIVSHPLTDGRPYDILYKDLTDPVKGGNFEFYFWFRNGFPNNHNAFAIEAYVFDKDGSAYSLGKYPAEDENGGTLDWSGDHINEKAGWYHYNKPMPKDVIAEKVAIKIFQVDPEGPGAMGPYHKGVNYAEDWTAFDEIRFTNTKVMNQDTLRDDEQGWESDDADLNEMGEYLNPWCIREGDSAIEMNCTFNKGDYGSTANLYKTFDKALKGGSFQFAVYNVVNSVVESEPKFKVEAFGYDRNGNKASLGVQPGGDSVLKYSGSTDSKQTFFGWNLLSFALPADKELVKLEIQIRDTLPEEYANALLFVDDIKFRGTQQAEGGGADNPPDTSDTSGSGGDDGTNPGTGVPAAPLGAAAAALLAGGAAICLRSRRQRRTND